MRRRASLLAGFGVALPEQMRQQDLWNGYFAEHFGHRRSAKIAFDVAGVKTRHAVANPLVEDVSSWSTGRRMERYLVDAVPLGKAALAAALEDAGVDAGAIGLLVVVSCTGYATPGVDVLLARDLGMSPSTLRVNVGHMGCHGALPALAVADNHVVANGSPAIVLCLELSSLHVQPPTGDLDQIVVHSLFGDAAAAVVLTPTDGIAQRGLAVVDSITQTQVTSIDDMSWTITDTGFRMTLSRHISAVVGREVRGLLDELLDRNSLALADVAAWAVHPGGPRILDEVQGALDLSASALAISREVLCNHGNCSSATILLTLDATRRHLDPAPGRNVVALAFGPGLTLCATLLRTEASRNPLPVERSM